MESFTLLYIAIGPGIALAVYLYYADKWEPEPKTLVVKSFLLGGLACFPTSYFEGVIETFFGWESIWNAGSGTPWWQKALYAFLGVALVEELCKFLFLKGFIYDDREFSEPFDGIVYGGMVGCGFATVENLLYVVPLGQEVGVFRMFTAVPGHAFEGMILGYFMGRAKFGLTPEKHLFFGLALVVILHGIYDTAVFSRAVWSFPVIFGMVFLGIYLGLRAKKELEKNSEVIEFCLREYFSLKDHKKKRPLTLKKIRERLSEGKLKPDDLLIEKKSGKEKLIKEIFSSKIISRYHGLAKTPVRGQPVKVFLVLYGLTFGLYFYFWFLRNYRDFKNYKRININPEVHALALVVLTLIPHYFYRVLFEVGEKPLWESFSMIAFHGALAGVQAAFLFFQIRMIKRFLKRRIKGTFRVFPIALAFFVLSGLSHLLPPDMPYYLFFLTVSILGQGGILAFVQKDLNIYWRIERGEPVESI